MTKKAYILVFDGFADWEIGHLSAELRRIGQIDVRTCSFSGDPIVSMGGLRIQPDMSLSQVALDDVLIFILPGGMMWEQEYPEASVESFLQRLAAEKIHVAAICAATTVLAKAGLLREKKHTSNSLDYLKKMVPGYDGHTYYVEEQAVCDGQVITASGLGAVDFTMAVLTALKISSPSMRSVWYDAFKNGIYPEDVTTHE